MSNATFNSMREDDARRKLLYPKHINNYTHIHTHMQQAKKLTVENVTRKDLLEKAFSLPSGWFVEVYVQDDGRVIFSSPMTGNTWTDDPHKVGKIEAMSIGDVEGMYLRDDGKVEIDVTQLGESGQRKVQKGEHYDRVEVLTKAEALDLIDDIAGNEEWDVNGLISEVNRIGTIRMWATKNKGKFVHNRGVAGLTLLSSKEAAKINYEDSDRVEDYADQLINTNDGLPSELE